ncbi:DsbA family protein [Candidatus Daviesbacteria bacterium]|nr:DsbA family protein [Candidatus Daviesbacteria bacterium]
MKTETKVLGIILIITLVLLFGGIFLLSKQGLSGTNEETVYQIDYSKGQKIGSDSAKVKLVEFSDLECPACAAAEPFVKKVKSDYPNKVQLIYRHFPLPQHTHSRQVAIFAEAAAKQGKFWEMHDKLFETQSQWTILPEKEAAAFFLNLAKELSLDQDKLNQDLEDPVVKSRVDEDEAESRRLGVNATPTFFLNGRKLNLQSFSELNTVVANELKK